MDLTVIIVNWNTRDLLAGCLTSLYAHSHNLNVETIVVDNNSADGSRDMVVTRFPRVQLINSGCNAGFARANNLAMEHVHAPHVLFLNPDTEVRADTLQHMLAFMQTHPEVGAVGCRIRDRSGSLQPLGLQWFPSPLTELIGFLSVSQQTYARLPRWIPSHDPLRSGYVRKLFGACLMIRQAVLNQIGLFDERFFMYCEDVDLCHRITSVGWKLYYLGDTEIMHLGGGAGGEAPAAFSVLMMCESMSKFMRKHYGAVGCALYRCVAFCGSQIRLAAICLVNVWCRLGLCVSASPLDASRRKYIAITKWALGLQKPVVRE